MFSWLATACKRIWQIPVRKYLTNLYILWNALIWIQKKFGIQKLFCPKKIRIPRKAESRKQFNLPTILIWAISNLPTFSGMLSQTIHLLMCSHPHTKRQYLQSTRLPPPPHAPSPLPKKQSNLKQFSITKVRYLA